MIGQEFIINFIRNEAFLIESKSVNIVQSYILEKQFKNDASFIFKVLDYSPTRRRIFGEIICYKIGTETFTVNQQSYNSELFNVDTIEFKDVCTNNILMLRKGGEEKVFYPKKPESVSRETPKTIFYNPIITNYKKTYYIKIKDLLFVNGGVKFKIRINDIGKSIDFTVINDDILEEFEAIKSFFANALGKKKFEIHTNIQVINGEITSTEASSLEILQINKELIDNIKISFVKKIYKKTTVDTTLFTLEEFFDTFTKGKLTANALYNDVNDFLDDALKITRSKHYKHLKYLAEKHKHDKIKLRFSIKPFAFLFLLEGTNRIHFIWETLDTKEATYVWSFGINYQILKEYYEGVSLNIIKIQEIGKSEYVKENSSNDNFKRVFHDYATENDGYLKWEKELKNILV